MFSPDDLYILPVDKWIQSFVEWMALHFRPLFLSIKWPVEALLEMIEQGLQSTPFLLFIVLFSLLAWRLASRGVALFTTLVSAHTAGDAKVIYVACMSIMLFAWFALVSVFFTTPAVRQGFFRFGRWFNRVTGITFIVLAIRVALAQQH